METSQAYTSEKHLKKSDSRFSTISISVGLVTSLVLIIYFVLIRTFALENVMYLRLVNAFILLAGIVVGERLCSSRIAHKIDYLKGIRVGTQVTIAATIPYSIFMWTYLKMDTELATFIQTTTNFGKHLTPLPACAAGIITIEGFVSGLVLTYVIMPYFKRK
ncbi:MAG: hypothetical protein H0W73_08705 [Bacteroidetes bacterium]|nr:hypothetical protein [Bacteroidota bacterium]